MMMVKFKFSDTSQESEGFLALAKRAKVICLKEQTYEVAKSALAILDEMGIAYTVIAEEGFDRACHSLRNSAASKI